MSHHVIIFVVCIFEGVRNDEQEYVNGKKHLMTLIDAFSEAE